MRDAQAHANERLSLEDRALRHAEPVSRQDTLEEAVRQRVAGATAIAGVCRRFAVRPGFDLGVFDISVLRGRPESGEIPPGLTVTILLEGQGRSWVQDAAEGRLPRSVPYRAATTYLCYTARRLVGTLRLPPLCRFRGVELRISPEFLAGQGLAALFGGLAATHPLAHLSDDGLWVGLLATPEPIAAIAGRLSGLIAEMDGAELAAEADALDLFLAILSLVEAPPPIRRSASRDAVPLRRARDLLEAEPQEAWTIASLARRVGLTEKRLTSGFRREHGRTVKAYLRTLRMDLAHRLMNDGEASVTEAAMAAGFSNLSHFAQIFRRHFGHAPSVLRNARVEAQRKAEDR